MISIRSFGSSSAGNCYYVTDGHTPLLLEAGIKFKDIQRDLNFQTSSIAGCLISHEHSDHAKAYKDIMKAGIDIYATQGTIEAIKATGHRIKPVQAMMQFTLGTWDVLPFGVEHDAADPVGYLLQNRQKERLLFITDSFFCRYKFTGISHLMIEANYSLEILNENIRNGSIPPVMKKRLMRSHFSLENVKDFLKANDLSKLQEIWLLHLSDSNSNAELFKREVQELTGKLVVIP
ncbi:MBL fold metallo-hydrolase [Mesobacillus subterraneus]|uniref:MBL fold metallo-hydrolase n=1 Tax=Mesobacillus subterraneus TaxID=285983 RepID=UPI002042643D|nr:MBL fold metallo-hydrolase [Mesobacillus subterraneus]MCM3573322.1 MBL fold metallo-hydrolase [Mesobacillus subterraneus]